MIRRIPSAVLDAFAREATRRLRPLARTLPPHTYTLILIHKDAAMQTIAVAEVDATGADQLLANARKGPPS